MEIMCREVDKKREELGGLSLGDAKFGLHERRKRGKVVSDGSSEAGEEAVSEVSSEAQETEEENEDAVDYFEMDEQFDDEDNGDAGGAGEERIGEDVQPGGRIVVLTGEERIRADKLLLDMGKKPEGTIAQPWRNEITAKNICTLRDGAWLNDNIVNQFQELV